MYQLINDSNCVLRIADGLQITNNPKNADRKKYEAWLAEGNTPEPAEPETPPVLPYDIARERAYKAEADSLFFQEQRGEVPAGTWQAKVDEIKSKFPKP